MTTNTVAALQQQLAAPFDSTEVKQRVGAVKGNRAMALNYIDARSVMDRLDAVVGVDGWSDEYQFLPDGSCLCKLRVRFGEAWIEKCDIGGPSEQPDESDRHKAAVSDALKRTAVKFGVGRYLYRLPSLWTAYDPQTKRLGKAPLPTATNGALRRELLDMVQVTGTALPALLRHYQAEDVNKMTDEQALDALRRLRAKTTA